MISSERVATGDDHEINIIAVLRVMWAHKYLVAVTTGVCALVAMYLALTAIPIYRAEILVTPVRETGMSSATSLANQFGGLASIAGLNLGSGSPDVERQAILRSRHLVEEFVKRNGVVPLLAADAKQQSSLWLAVEKFRKNVLAIDEDKPKGVTTVRIDWTDPVIAARWANGFVALANEFVRTRALEDSSRSIDYLNKQIAQTNVLEVQRVMYNLIESETKTLMLANARVEYAFTIVDPAVPPEVRISPKRSLMVLSGVVLGLFIGSILALAYNTMGRHRVKVRQSA